MGLAKETIFTTKIAPSSLLSAVEADSLTHPFYFPTSSPTQITCASYLTSNMKNEIGAITGNHTGNKRLIVPGF